MIAMTMTVRVRVRVRVIEEKGCVEETHLCDLYVLTLCVCCIVYMSVCMSTFALYHYSLPYEHRETGWALCQIGRAYFELNRFEKSIEHYKRSQEVEPHRLAGMEYYSTALWQRKSDVDLSFLAQRCVQLDYRAAETWIVVGNCFSLQKEHSTALKFFRRAIQLDQHLAYAYTLFSHEYVANEDFDKAITGFRRALVIDERHYNAWYGLGHIYYRQEKYEQAAYHFK
jgi:anaphase-promoting complex subunit 3